MPDYRKLYFLLARRLADAVDCLILAQQEAEQLYIEEENDILRIEIFSPEEE